MSAPDPSDPPLPESRARAQARVDRIVAFREELAALEAEGLKPVDGDARQAIEAHHGRLLAALAERFDVDAGGSHKQLSLGMRIASLIGALALSAAVFFFFHQIWGLIPIALQVGLLTLAPVVATLLAAFAASRERTLYFTSLLALIAFSSFVLDLSLLGRTFNLVPSHDAFLAWAVFGLLLAYAWGLKLVLVAALVCIVGYLSAAVGAWSGMYWLSLGERPEHFLLAGGLIAAAGFLPLPRYPEFADVYRVFGFLTALTAVLVLAHWGASSYLPVAPGLAEAGYQVFGFGASAALIVYGVRSAERKLFNLGATFFILFLYTKLFDWWWAWMPKSVFFLLIGLIAVAILVALVRIRNGRRGGRT